ncbi:MAG: glycoside hydrolase family protein [Eubacterium sp.]|nr:glycoside hydrolase family protein [Eubacterium sp.]
MIKKFEGCKTKAYQDSVGVWTIGYGTTNADKDLTGLTVKAGVTITKAQALEFLEKTIPKKYLPRVLKYDDKYHFNQNQLDALVSFAYNIGSIDGLTAKGTRSIKEIKAKIPAYCNADGVKLTGLVRRRKAEQKLFAKKLYRKIKREKGGTIREEASKTSNKVATIKSGKKVRVLREKKGSDGKMWLKVKKGNYKGWMKKAVTKAC